MAEQIEARHGHVCAYADDFFGYFGWPTVTRMEDGTLVAVASGLRSDHVCPFGRNTMCTSRDEGESWSSPRVVNDSPLDDRDAGIVGLGGQGLLLSWFTSDNRPGMLERAKSMTGPARERWLAGLRNITDDNVPRFAGSWVRRSDDAGETWQRPVRVAVSAPHGPIRLINGRLLYLGKESVGLPEHPGERKSGRIAAMDSQDGGATWTELGTVPLHAGTGDDNYHEPHVVELASGKLIGMIRIQNAAGSPDLSGVGITSFSMVQTESDDGGRTWTPVRPLGFHGSPPHVMRHSSGVLVLTYGYRLEPYGERVALSRDEGRTWEHDLVLRDDGPDGDLGYPASVELGDGSVLTVYYQKPSRREDKCALLTSRWRIP